MATHRVVVTDHDFDDLEQERTALSAVDAELVSADARTPEAVIDQAAGADGLLVQFAEITEEVFETLDDLEVVGRYGIGVDTIDVESAAEHGVAVVNVPDYCVDEVPEHALALLLACERRIATFDGETREGTWNWKTGRPIFRMRGRTLGLAGFGKLPRRLVEKVEGLGFELIAYDPYVDVEEMDEYGVEKVDFDELLARSGAISVHTPLTEETRNLFDAEAFDAMKDDAVLVNVARGAVVDTEALYDALADGQLRAAGLDVLPEEPPGDSPLFDLDSVVVTPHVAWYSEESLVALRRTLAEDVARVLRGGTPKNRISDRPSE